MNCEKCGRVKYGTWCAHCTSDKQVVAPAVEPAPASKASPKAGERHKSALVEIRALSERFGGTPPVEQDKLLSQICTIAKEALGA